MPKKKKTGLVEDIVSLVALMPWWGGIILAVLSYLFLHSIASREVAAVVQPGQLSTQVTGILWKTAASFGQYLLPLLCLVGAAISAWQANSRSRLVANITQNESADVLNDMSWQEFESLVGEAFRLQGYQVTETGGGGADGGVDLTLRRGSEKFLVQCKQWRAFKVSVEVVRELYGVMAASGAAGGFVVTSGRFTEEATQFASGRNVKLVDGVQLRGLLHQAKAARSSTNLPIAQQTSCPLCSKAMKRRTAKQGRNAGNEFWGCTAYPACKGTRPIS